MRNIKTLLLLFMALPLAGQSIEQVDSVLDIAEIRIQAGAYQSALEFINKAKQIDNNDVAVYLTEARVNALMGNYDEAMKNLDKVTDIEPDNLRVIHQKAEVLYLKGEEKDAQKLLDDAVKTYPGMGEFYYYRGLLGNERERFSKSIPDFEKALSLGSNIESYKIHLAKGVAHFKLMELEQALTEHNKALGLNKNDASAYHSRGMVYYELGEYNEAIADFSRALQFYNKNPETLFNLGMAYFRAEDSENACVYFHRSCQLGNKNACKMIVLECGQRQ
ncbi:MAG: tetratricopeptide repeat protein [Bacteroidetes bacterium]|jgi:tetratricopeptide (TPR) repeat protein|nr:tetratricopeptide repeat protein [Bacteroidota bacterium]